MAKRQKRDASSIDGFAAFKAVRDSHLREQAKLGVDPAAEAMAAARVSRARTAMPTRHHVRCYECHYDFMVAGRVRATGCPKCHTTLEAKDHVIDAEWQSVIKTIGSVHVKQGGAVVGGTLHALDLVVDGAIRGGDIYACENVDCRAGSRIDLSFVRGRDVIVRRGAHAVSKKRVVFGSIDVAGELHAKLAVEGLVRVRAGGLLRGSIEGAHLEVEEGGGVKASLEIRGPVPPVDAG